MDAFGTVASAIDLANKIVGYIQAVKGAKEDRRKLLSEVSALEALLRILHGRFNIKGNDDDISNLLVKAGIRRPFDQCCQALQSIVEKLEDMASSVDKVGGLSPFAELMKNIRWPFCQDDIKAMLEKIERLKSLILLAFQASLMEFVDKTHDELKDVGLNVEKIKSTVLALETKYRDQMKSLEVDFQTLKSELQNSAKGVINIRQSLDKQQDQMNQVRTEITIIREGQELQKILKLLSPLDFNGKHKATLRKHTPGTGEWFLEHPKFLDWQRGKFNVLWCPGDPGAGKSVMASAVIHRLQRNIPEDVAVVFIYFEYTTEYTTMDLIEAILKQLVRRRVTSSGMESLQKLVGGGDLAFDELLAVLGTEMRTYSRVFVVIDALDETPTQIWVPLLEHLQELSGNVGLLATSRDLGDIAAEFRGKQRLDVMAHEADMRMYIEGRLSGSTGPLKRLLRANESLHEEIVTGIMKKADGMFLLARLHMNSVEVKARETDLRGALSKLPGDLRSAYDETMGRISDEDRELAYYILSWVIHAARPMSIDDLRYALAVREGITAIDANDLYDEAHLTSICVGLVMLQDLENNKSGKVVGLVHYSTQEYLQDHFASCLPPHTHLAITCLQYLSFDVIGALPGANYWASRCRLVETPFAEYAISYWGPHARAHFYSDDKTIRNLVVGLLRNKQRVAVLGYMICGAHDVSAIQLCTALGLKDYVEYLLREGFDVNSEDSCGITAVMEAAQRGQGEIMQLLLDQGVDVNSTGRNGDTPLSKAIQNKRQGIVELLLTRGDVDVDSRGNHGRTPLSWAAASENRKVMELLLARDNIDVNSRDDDGRTPLSWAVTNKHRSGIVKLLLTRRDVNVDSHDDNGRTPLSWAVTNKQRPEIVKLFLARQDVDVNSRDNSGRTPLSWAVANKHRPEIAKFLLARQDIDADSRDIDGKTPLARAAQCGNKGVVKLLLARDDVCMNSQSENGYTPLAWAISENQEGVARLLLARDDVDVGPKNVGEYVSLHKPLMEWGSLQWLFKGGDWAGIPELLRQAADRRAGMVPTLRESPLEAGLTGQ